jgi:imidazolonepropionase-like amidohydrolase
MVGTPRSSRAVGSLHRAGARWPAGFSALGTLTPGKEADIVLLEGNPLDDISATRRVRSVFKGGTQYRPEPPVPPLPWR